VEVVSPATIFVAILHAGCHQHHEEWKWSISQAMTRVVLLLGLPRDTTLTGKGSAAALEASMR